MQVLADRPESADQYEFSVEDGDVILLATDGLFDNVPDKLLVAEMSSLQHCKDEVKLQQCANTIALMARKLSKDPKVKPQRFSLEIIFNHYNFSVFITLCCQCSRSRN